jgi:hypothetical protein
MRAYLRAFHREEVEERPRDHDTSPLGRGESSRAHAQARSGGVRGEFPNTRIAKETLTAAGCAGSAALAPVPAAIP